MKMIRSMAALVAVGFLYAVPVLAQSVKTDYDHKATFQQYHTFSFNKVQASDPLYEGRIRDEVSRDLTAHGLQMVPSGGDLAVAAIGGMHTQQEYDTFYNGLGGGGFGWHGWGGWGGGWGTETTTTVNQVPVGTLIVNLQVPVGTLIVNLFDTQTHQLVWRGTATDQLSNNSDKNTKKLDKAIDKMFNKYPAKGAA